MEGLGRRLKKSESESHSVVSDSLRPHGLYCRWNSPGQNTGLGCLSLLQGIFPNQGSNPGLLHCRWILYQLSHRGSPSVLEWEAQEGCIHQSSSVQFSHSVVSDSLRPHESQHARPSCPSPSPGVHSDSCPSSP